jgi:gluconokinase
LRGNHVVFVHLVGSKDQIGRRMIARTGHYMPPGLLDSQIATLEPPGPDENVLEIDVGAKPAIEAAEIIAALGLRPAAGSSALGASRPGESSVPSAST